MRAVYTLLLFSICVGTAAQAQHTCNVRTYGAKGDGTTKDTHSIQAAIDDCAKAGGTVIISGSPMFVSGPLALRSNITLSIATGTTLAASEDHEDFPVEMQFNQSARSAFLTAKNAKNITIFGGGTIDGRGQSWWPHREPGYTRPRLIVFDHCQHILMENITAQNSAMWQIVPYYSDDLTFRNMKVFAPPTSHNTDGIDPFSSSHILLDHVTIDTGDDNVAIKSGQPNSPGPDAPSHDITIRDCVFMNGHGMSIGSEVSGGVQRVTVERVRFKGTGTGIRIKSNRDRGNDIGPLTYTDIDMEDVGSAIVITEFYPKIPNMIDEAAVTRLTPHFHDITIKNLRVKNAKEAGVVVGLPESPIMNLTLQNISVEATKGLQLKYAHASLKNVEIRSADEHNIDIGPGVVQTPEGK